MLPLFFTVFGAVANEPLQVVRVNPSGEDVPSARQIVIQFDRQVVPIGSMTRKKDEVPVTISPAVDCQWRWLDRTSLACQLGEKIELKKSTQYALTIWPGITTQDSETLKQPFVYTFITERPLVSRVWLKTWLAPGFPVLQVTFNQAVSKDSVLQHMEFRLEEDKESGGYPIAVEADPDDRQLPRFIKAPGENVILDFGEQENSKVDDEYKSINGIEARRVWLLKPRGELPLDSRIELKVEPGLVSASGKEVSNVNRAVLAFDTFPEFRFNGVSCRDNNNKKLLITGQGFNLIGKCNPLGRAALNFSVPVLNFEVKNKIRITPELAGGRKDYDPWANQNDYSRLSYPHKKGRGYDVWLPENLKAAQQYLLKSKPGQIVQDEFGRGLNQEVDQFFLTDHRKPDFKLVHRQSVLESGIDSELPVYVTNLRKLRLDYKKLTVQGAEKNQHLNLEVANAEDVSFAMPMHIREMLEGQSGAVYGRINTVPELKKTKYERLFFAQVSSYQLHVKFGHFNSLVWVTDFATGAAVADARVIIYKDALSSLSDNKPVLAEAKTDKEGIAVLSGGEKLDPELETFGWKCSDDDCPRLFVRVEKNGEMAVLPLNHHFEVNTYRASGYSVFSRQRKKYGHIHSWGTTAQGIYRAGDTIQYKFYVRNQDNRTFVEAPREGYTLEIIDPAGKAVDVVKDIELSEFGAFSAEYKVPETALIGWYRFRLKAKFSSYDWQPMKVLVSDFTPSPFKVSTDLNGDLFHPGEELEVLTTTRLHSGGAYTDAQARVTVALKPRYFSPDHPVSQGFRFDRYRQHQDKVLMQKTEPLNDRGEHDLRLTLSETGIVYGKIRVESSIQDDRGKYISAAASADYLAVDRLVGLKSTQWLFKEDEEAVIQYLVVDPVGEPAEGTNVTLKIEREETVSARVKGAGNAFVSQFNTRWVSAGECMGEPENEPLSCRFIPKQPGTYRITAEITDTRGRPHTSEIKVWVAGKGRVIWSQPNNNSLQILPEKSEYKVGDTARYMVKNPYPGAKALITLERYGVLKQWVMTLEQSTPVIEFSIEKELLPGFYLSVVVMSPRVAKPLGEGEIDLGKPAFKIGYIKVPVRDPWKEIDIQIATDQDVYKPGDRVKAVLQAKVRNNESDEPIELAVVALDEAVLDLIAHGEGYFDPYRGFYNLDGLDMQNYSLLKRLVGRQKFEKKGANAGGDGGNALSMRSIFKYVSYWNPSIKTDSEGRAEIEFTLPDNLTGWRILALAVTPGDRMGLGDGSFKVNQPTEIRPVMPNQITEGDRFKAGFSVMNRMDQERELTVVITAEGEVESGVHSSQKITLGAYKRQTVYLEIESAKIRQTRIAKQGEILFTVKAFDQEDGDALKFQLPVLKQRSLETAASYDSTVQKKVEEEILVPDKIYPDTGDISVELSSSVIGNLAGAFKYMRNYPYTCWEQKLSKGVMASHFQRLKSWLPDDLSWPESASLSKKMLEQAANYQAPNGGMVYYLPKNDYVSPYLSAYTALAFNWLRDSGNEIPEKVEQKLHAYLEKLLRKDIVPDFYTKGMSSTVRAVALAALSGHGTITLSDLQRYRPHIPYMSLFGKAHFLQAALAVKGAGKMVKEVEDRIYAHAHQSGGKFSFNEELDDSYSRILATPLRANCSILSSLTKKQEQPVADMPFKLVRTITQTRGGRDHWENTQENMFCMNALIDYSRKYEEDKPDMKISVAVNDQEMGKVAFNDYRNEAVAFVKPIQPADIGKKLTVSIDRQGVGRLYHATRLQYAPLQEYSSRVNAGIDIRREYSVERDGKWVLLDSRDKFSASQVQIKRGELVRVDVYVSLPTARNFVVVEDSVPGGLEPVNRDLATASEVDAEKGDFKMAGGAWWFQFDDWQSYQVSRWGFYHREIKHDVVRFYSDYLPAGRYHLSYTAQAVAVGEFARMPVHAEEMYDPDVFGKGKRGKLVVEDKN